MWFLHCANRNHPNLEDKAWKLRPLKRKKTKLGNFVPVDPLEVSLSEGYDGGSVATGRVSQAGQVEEEERDKKTYLAFQGWGLSRKASLLTLVKNNIARKPSGNTLWMSDRNRSRRTQQRKWTLRYGVWNIQGIRNKQQELLNRKIDITSILSETKKMGKESENTKDFMHFYSGVNKDPRAQAEQKLIEENRSTSEEYQHAKSSINEAAKEALQKRIQKVNKPYWWDLEIEENIKKESIGVYRDRLIEMDFIRRSCGRSKIEKLRNEVIKAEMNMERHIVRRRDRKATVDLVWPYVENNGYRWPRKILEWIPMKRRKGGRHVEAREMT
ncbi:hypothetical protein ILUMI_21389 [Ignelater luminosus]|uniref:Uncharacterized protein n=1 Tax=Ignelater luminosus TaxID=2038154 RepID=A0A8K0CIV8_IGNLU|nr:hypothetical protein ILUMI_21389 [Ignelater luminosus]